MNVSNIINYLSIFLALLLVLPLHEFAHAFVAVKCGDPTPKLNDRYTLNPFAHFDIFGLISFVLVGFGWAKPVPINANNFTNYKRGCFLVSIAGVVANFLLAFVAYPLCLLATYIPNFGYFDDVIFLILYYIFRLSLILFIFNLLPIYPLDGFRAIDAFCKKKGNVYQFWKKNSIYLLYLFFALGFLADMLNVPELDVLGLAMNFLFKYVSFPITAFWGLFF